MTRPRSLRASGSAAAEPNARTAIDSSETQHTGAERIGRLASRALERGDLGEERLGGVVVSRVPQHPAIRPAVRGAPDLRSDLASAEGPLVERIVAKVLQPGPHLYRRALRALAH